MLKVQRNLPGGNNSSPSTKTKLIETALNYKTSGYLPRIDFRFICHTVTI